MVNMFDGRFPAIVSKGVAFEYMDSRSDEPEVLFRKRSSTACNKTTYSTYVGRLARRWTTIGSRATCCNVLKYMRRLKKTCIRTTSRIGLSRTVFAYLL